MSSRNPSNSIVSANRCKLEYPPVRYADIVFLIEHSGSVDKTKTHHLMAAVQSLTEHVQKHGFDIQARFAFVIYHLQKTSDNFLFVKDFMRVRSLKGILKTVEAELRSELENEFIHELHPKVVHHTTVERSLEVTRTILQLRSEKDDTLGLQEGDINLSYQSNADLHVVAISNLHSKRTQSQKDVSDLSKMNDRVEKLKADIEEEISYMVENTDSLFSSPTSLHFFFSRSNTAAKSYLGDPALSVQYTDCTHFNKALTLKALIAAGNHQGSSLQAHMISQGVEMKVSVLGDLAKRDCILGISPTLSTPTTLQPTFSDKCLGNHIYAGQTDYYCSPLHGWTKKDQNGGNLKAALFKGKAPLTGEFATTHADLAKTAEEQSEGDLLPMETLSIVSDLDTCKYKPQPTHKPFVSGTPRILKWRPSEPFVKKIIAGREPVVLRDTVIQTWPAMSKWNFSYIAENIGSEILSSVKCTNSFVTFDPDRRTPLKLNISLPFVETNMTKEMFFDCVQASEEGKGACPDGFKGHYYFGAVPDNLRDDVMPDQFLYNTEKDYESKKQFMWISSAGMITHTHFDQDYNFFVQLVGKKRFTLWSSSQHELMYMYPRIHPMWHKSRVNYRAVDLFEFPAFSQTKALQIELGPGDMLHVPPYVWHYVETLTPSVSLSTWSHDHNLYDHMNSIYRHDHKFDLLENPRGKLVMVCSFRCFVRVCVCVCVCELRFYQELVL